MRAARGEDGWLAAVAATVVTALSNAPNVTAVPMCQKCFNYLANAKGWPPRKSCHGRQVTGNGAVGGGARAPHNLAATGELFRCSLTRPSPFAPPIATALSFRSAPLLSGLGR